MKKTTILLFSLILFVLFSFSISAVDFNCTRTNITDNCNLPLDLTLDGSTYTVTDASSDGLINTSAPGVSITLDCNGSTIIGNGSGHAIRGVHQRLEIKNCNFRDYGAGIYNTVSHLSIANSTFANIGAFSAGLGAAEAIRASITAQNTNNATIENITIINASNFALMIRGLGGANAENNTVRNMVVNCTSGTGAQVFDRGNQLFNVTFNNCPTGLQMDENTDNLYLANITITGSTASNGGIYLSSGNNLSDNITIITPTFDNLLDINIDGNASILFFGTDLQGFILDFGPQGNYTTRSNNILNASGVTIDLGNGTFNNVDTTAFVGGPFFFAINTSITASFNRPAVTTVSNVNCDSFTIYRSASFLQGLNNISSTGTIIATENNKGGNCANNLCSSISCRSSTLSFSVPSFSSYGVVNGIGTPSGGGHLSDIKQQVIGEYAKEQFEKQEAKNNMGWILLILIIIYFVFGGKKRR